MTGATTNLFVYGLPYDSFTRAQARFSAVTAAQVMAAAQKYLVPDKMLYLVVGDMAKVKGDLEKLNLGTIEAWTPDGTRADSRSTR
ncbi:MAG: hypothetical protein QM736_23545 [Vicinamibacterales bacterium]